MPVKVEIKLDVESLTDYMIYQIYMSKAGVIAIILGVFNVILASACVIRKDYLYMALFLAVAVVILAVFPAVMRKRIERQVQKSKRIGASVTYEFSDEGVTTTTAEGSGKASWKAFKRAASRKRILMLCTASRQAVILPVDQIAEEYTRIVDLIYANMPAPAVMINRLDRGKKPGQPTRK